MPCYIVGGDSYDRKLVQCPDEFFEAMVEELHNPTPVIPKGSRWRIDGSYDSKPLDPDYFNKYYKKTYVLIMIVLNAVSSCPASPIWRSTKKP